MLNPMAWDPLNEVLFAGHLDDVQVAVDAALAAAQLDALVIAAGSEHPAFQDDQAYPFRPNPWLAWLVPPPAAADCLLVLRPGPRPRLVFVPPGDYWRSPPDPPSDPWLTLFDLEVVRDAAAACAAVTGLQGRVAWIGEPAPPAGWLRNPADLLARLEQARCRKSRYELTCMREANRIAVAGHLAAERCFREGGAEYDIHLAFLRAVRQPETGLPYPPIVALNQNAATLHYQRREARAPARSLALLIDAGATCRGYASDITRTWASAPGLFASLVEGVNALQQELCEAVAPGQDWPALHLHAHLLVARLLHETDVLRTQPESAVETGVSGAFLPHGLGHLLGVQVHDVGGFRPSADEI